MNLLLLMVNENLWMFFNFIFLMAHLQISILKVSARYAYSIQLIIYDQDKSYPMYVVNLDRRIFTKVFSEFGDKNIQTSAIKITVVIPHIKKYIFLFQYFILVLIKQENQTISLIFIWHKIIQIRSIDPLWLTFLFQLHLILHWKSSILSDSKYVHWFVEIERQEITVFCGTGKMVSDKQSPAGYILCNW